MMNAMPSASRQTSSLERLKSLPALFRGADLTIRFQWTSKTASQYLYLWKARGLVQPLGGHSDVFANTIARPHPNWEAALLMAMPSAIVIGIECLRRSGWTTQIPSLPDVAVLRAPTSPVFRVEHFSVIPRPAAWFKALGVKDPGLNASGASLVRPDRARSIVDAADRTLPALRPAWALADMVKEFGWGGCGLQPDDIDWGVVGDKDRRDWSRACAALGVSPHLAPELADDVGDAVDHAQIDPTSDGLIQRSR